jgi:hypothetical protein
VTGNFTCLDNYLTSLEGSPINVGGHFNCSYNKLIDLSGCPDRILQGFHCEYNPIYEIYSLFYDPYKIELFNYYDCIRMENGEPAVIIDRLNDFLEEIGKPLVKSVKGYISI